VRIIARKALREFWRAYGDAEQPLKAWYKEVEKAKWDSPHELKLTYPSASILEDNRVVFNLKGNHYRLIAKISFDFQICWIRFIGTHAQYDKINAHTI
jgi:Uncharacterized protein conserved in bacteria